MGKERIQPTPIDADEYEQFRQFVRDVHGRVRGNLATELENALREYRESYYGGDRLKRIEDDIATIKANISEAEADGGTAALSGSDGNDARPRDSQKPAPNQPREKKVRYLIGECVSRHNNNSDSGQVARGSVASVVDSEYGFGDQLKEEYVDEVFDRIIERFDAEPHPRSNSLFLWGDALDDAKEKSRKEADDELDDLS